MMNSFYFNDAVTFINDIIKRINRNKEIPPEKKEKIYTHISSTYKDFSPTPSSTDIPFSCRLSMPFYKEKISGQLDFSIEYNYHVNKEKIKSREIIIGIYKPNGGNVNKNSTSTKMWNKIYNHLEDMAQNTSIDLDSNNQINKEKKINAEKGLNIHDKPGDYNDSFNTQHWCCAIKYSLPDLLFYELNTAILSPMIDKALNVLNT